ncbi:hypothetical protein [Carboxylicivirga sp. N1Y90]|uniref:hypothetical protein n=1 Tax=Carboxylicivirga fragile TaxID=3417571 RepID=UPI003D3324EA|nr:hypothetical protein [Marinilabiliaceae bacterium N1Y90]
MLDERTGDLEMHTEELEECTGDLVEHTGRLDERTGELKKHTEGLDERTGMLEDHARVRKMNTKVNEEPPRGSVQLPDSASNATKFRMFLINYIVLDIYFV